MIETINNTVLKTLSEMSINKLFLLSVTAVLKLMTEAERILACKKVENFGLIAGSSLTYALFT